ncbi:3-deoxy-D-manno-octulosonic acid transferase [bacterium BMS3Abin14]|nr:3-deoxy-D-manno-octulosonic acid transferase [bacterium BMS3Abin14]
MFITAETEFWPNFFFWCFLRGVPVIVVNGRISDRSFVRYLRFRWFFRPFLQRVSLFLMQSEEDARRILALGALEGSVEVTGNTKYDVNSVPAELPVEVRNWAESSFLLVAGSTHGGEEEIILNALEMTGLSDVRLALVPRHPERFNEVADLLADRGIPFARLSGIVDGREISERVILVDAMGVLDGFYEQADAAFVGGSLVPVGGHNLLEPAMHGVPVLTGPNLQNFREITDALIKAGGCRIVEDGDSLANALRSLKDNWQEWERMGNAAKSVFARRTGAARRDVDAIFSLR